MRWTVSNKFRVRPSVSVRVGLCCLALVSAFDVSASDDPNAAGSVEPPLPTVVHLGEFRHSAHTLPAGTVALHPLFYPSTVGVTDRTDLKVPILGLLDGPEVALELMVAAALTEGLPWLVPGLLFWDFYLTSRQSLAESKLLLGTVLLFISSQLEAIPLSIIQKSIKGI